MVYVCGLLHCTVVSIIVLALLYRLFDCISVVKMPNPQYYIELDNSTVASFDTASSTAEGLVAGSTELKLKGHSILDSHMILTALEFTRHMWAVSDGFLILSVEI